MGDPCRRDPGMDAPAPRRQERAYRSPFDLAFSPDGRMLAVSDRTAGCLYVFDAGTGDLAKTIPLRGRPSGLAWESAGKVVVCEYDAGTVAEVDAETGQVLRRFFVGPKPIGVAVAPDKGLLVVCDFGLHTISIVDFKTGRRACIDPRRQASVLRGDHAGRANGGGRQSAALGLGGRAHLDRRRQPDRSGRRQKDRRCPPAGQFRQRSPGQGVARRPMGLRRPHTRPDHAADDATRPRMGQHERLEHHRSDAKGRSMPPCCSTR